MRSLASPCVCARPLAARAIHSFQLCASRRRKIAALTRNETILHRSSGLLFRVFTIRQLTRLAHNTVRVPILRRKYFSPASLPRVTSARDIFNRALCFLAECLHDEHVRETIGPFSFFLRLFFSLSIAQTPCTRRWRRRTCVFVCARLDTLPT